MRILWSSLRSLFFALLVLVGGAPARAGEGLPSFASVRAQHASSDGKLLDRHGALLQEQRLRWQGRSLGWVPLTAMSPSLPEAVLAVEDKRFPEHHGVDWRALAAAAWQDLLLGRRRGASTITMQTVGFLEKAGPRRGRRGIWAKLEQGRLALALERAWTKQEILEAYLNLVTYRGEYQGVGAAARALFGKAPHGLDRKESFLLASLLRAPGMSAEAAGWRLCAFAAQRPELGSCPELRRFVRAALALHPPAPEEALAPHLARRLLRPERPEQRSSLDAGLQRAALAIVRDQLSQLSAQNARDAAVIAVDNRSAEVLVYIGGAGSFSAAPEVDMAESRRQAGSTLKPFLYGLAFANGYLEPDSWLLDEPFELALERGSYEPDNYDHRFHGPVPAKVALASSLNVPAVRVVELVGVDDFRSLLDRLGFRALREGEHYGPSLALGTADVTLVDLVQAYLALANGGRWRPLRFRPDDPRARSLRVLPKESAHQLAAILSDRGFRALTFGWDSLLATPYPSAVKTGTSKDMRDNWCVGFSRDFTVGVWVGNAAGEPMRQVTGVSGAAPVWRAVMDRLHRSRHPAPFPALKAAAPVLDRARLGRILYPPAGAILAVDPDIPPAHQRVPFEVEGGGGALFLNGLPVSSSWQPARGKYRLSLRGESGQLLDEVHFEVR